jgi:RNA polymerase sigma-70 factor (ECF subfamily)
VAAVAPASVERPQPRSVDATRELYERHSRRILGYCVSLLGSREDAEDAVQTTFMNAQRALDRGVVPEYELAWLFKIAKNVCNNRRMATWRRGRVEAVRDLDELQDTLPSPERDSALSIDELTRALSGIPARQRQALMLREWQGLSYAEIGKELGVSVAAVETLIFRARKSVADELTRSETTRVASLATTFFSAVRWLFGGSAAPLKVAAATATAVTVAIVPAANVQPVKLPALAPATPAVTGTEPHARPTIATSAAQTPKHAVASVPVRAVAPDRPLPAPVPGHSADQAKRSSAPAGGDTGQVKSDVNVPLKTPDPVQALPPVEVPKVPIPPVEVPDLQVPPLPVPLPKDLPQQIQQQVPVQLPPLP